MRKVRVTNQPTHTCFWYNYDSVVGEEFELVCEDNREYKNSVMVRDWPYGPAFVVLDKEGAKSLIRHEDGELVRWEDVEGAKKSTHNKYSREIKPGVWVDIYDVLNAWKVTDPCLQHATKKVLQAGERGHKDRLEDLQDIVDSTQRAIEMHKEWNKE